MEDIWIMLQRGGIIMIPLILCSIISLAIIIEKIIALRKKKIINSEIVSVIENIKSNADIDLAVSICEKHKGVFSNIIQIGLNNVEKTREQVKELFIDQGRQETRVLERGLGILETIAAIAPLLGLLGTVIGMIKVFNVISVQGVGQAEALSGGISEALITTVVGLSIGIPTLVFYNYFTDKAEDIILDIEKFSNDLVNRIGLFKNSD
ncbi:MAG: MotA/TolQ/ExbB proton channel family protein [candidate division KSB1 bacterium]|jgi:biopolymer transport protein ExbB|nr:MotA/TolQ/ExbB proton channel family protein [candidate division KSB1 bacterium]